MFEPTKFVYAFFNFNTIYQVDWKNSIDRKEILPHDKIFDEKRGNERNLFENEQQDKLLDFILSQIDFQIASSELNKALNNLEKEGINVVKELEKITLDKNVTDRMKRKFLESFENLLSGNFQDRECFYKSIKSVITLIYNVRNNIFHGNKDRFQLENREQQIRLRIYAEVIQSICQLAIKAVAKEANCPNILKVKFDKENMPRIRPRTIELTSTETTEIFNNIPRGNLFYPCSGSDTFVPLKLFLESPIETFYFADISYLRNVKIVLPIETEIFIPNQNRTNPIHNQSRRQQQFRQSNSLIGKELITKIERTTAPSQTRFLFFENKFRRNQSSVSSN